MANVAEDEEFSEMCEDTVQQITDFYYERGVFGTKPHAFPHVQRIVEAALAQAREEGRKAGIEEAAKAIQKQGMVGKVFANQIRALVKEA